MSDRCPCGVWDQGCEHCHHRDAEIERLQAVLGAARTQREYHDPECLCVVCLALADLDGEEQGGEAMKKLVGLALLGASALGGKVKP